MEAEQIAILHCFYLVVAISDMQTVPQSVFAHSSAGSPAGLLFYVQLYVNTIWH